jgi:ribosome-associated toxin RatA of RatAB toxin-antitoxin module
MTTKKEFDVRTVEVIGNIPSLTCAQVYARLSDFAAYPEFSPAVRSVQTREQDGRSFSEWEVNFRDGILCWTEEDVFDHANHTLRFVQTAGDIDQFSGEWSVRDDPAGPLVRFHCQFDMGIPGLADILEPIAEQALRDNARSIIAGLLPAVQFIAMEDA